MTVYIPRSNCRMSANKGSNLLQQSATVYPSTVVLEKATEDERALENIISPTQGPRQLLESREVDNTSEKSPLDESWLEDDSRDTQLVDSAGLSQGVSESSTRTVDLFVQLGDHDDYHEDDLQEVFDHHQTYLEPYIISFENALILQYVKQN